MLGKAFRLTRAHHSRKNPGALRYGSAGNRTEWGHRATRLDVPYLRGNRDDFFHTLASRSLFDKKREEEEKRKIDSVTRFHSSAGNERAAALMLGFGALAAASFAGAQGVKAYNEWKASRDQAAEAQEEEDAADQARAQSREENQSDSATKEEVNDKASQKQQEGSAESSKGRENIFKEWFGVGVGSKYYEGGFDATMSRREAALILGVRESSSATRIKEAHRKLLILNHPDTGGSTYMAGKINEAKELLMKGK